MGIQGRIRHIGLFQEKIGNVITKQLKEINERRELFFFPEKFNLVLA